jgi:pullulanase/glycogen debranching enzyme
MGLATPKTLTAPATGRSFPIGATLVAGGANFSVFSRSATGIELLLFDRVEDARPSRVIPIDPAANRTYHYWHVFVPGVQAGQIYGFRAYGPFEPDRGLRFDASKLLLDPYGRTIAVPKNYSRDAARREGDNTATAMKSVVTDPHAYDWEGDVPLKRPWSRTIIYEMHVRGFTGIPAPAWRNRNVAHMQDWSRGYRTFCSWASQRSSCFPCFSSTLRMRPEGERTTGATHRSHFSRHTRHTARVRTRWVR